MDCLFAALVSALKILIDHKSGAIPYTLEFGERVKIF